MRVVCAFVVAGLVCALAGAAASSGSASASKRGFVRYLVSVKGSYHVHAEERFDCANGATVVNIEDDVLTVSTPKPQGAWVSAGPNSATPPRFLRSGPGVYGFEGNGWMAFRVTVHVSHHHEHCEEPPSDEHCNQATFAGGRFEGPQGPTRMYLVTAAGTCASDYAGNFVADLHGDAAYARVPMAAIRHRVPSTFGFHRLQKELFNSDWHATAEIDWDAHIAPADELVAVATASRAERGQRVTLDGSNSFKGIRSYRWRLTSGKGCPKEVAFAPQDLEGRTVRFPALCTFKAELTVSDGKETDSETITVPVKPRPWKTPVSSARDGVLNTKLVYGFLQLGRNVCAFDGLAGEQVSGHILHRSGPGGNHETRGGFELAEITTGPFKGNFYVAAYRTKVRRAALTSSDLDADDLWTANASAGDYNDFAALRDSVRDHEELHSTLIERALAKSDRATAIEAMVGDDRDALFERVNVALVELETALTDATSDENVKAKMPREWNQPATVRVRDGGGGFVTWRIPSLAQLGDGG